MEIQGYTLSNLEKLDRALNGIQLSDSTRKGGVGNGAYFDGVWKRGDTEINADEVETLEFAVLAEYDKFAGTIKRGADKVKLGSFWNFKARKPHETPHVEFIYRFGHKVITVPDGKELPGEVKAQKILKEAMKEENEERLEAKNGKRLKKAKKE